MIKPKGRRGRKPKNHMLNVEEANAQILLERKIEEAK